MARKNNLIELTLEVKRKGTEQITKYKKELFELKKAANDLNKTLNATQKQLKQDVKNTSVKELGQDSKKSQGQIKKLEAALEKVTQELKDQKKAQSDLKKESNAKIQAVKSGAKQEISAYKKTQSALNKKRKEQRKSNKTNEDSVNGLQRLGNAAATVNGPLNDVSGRINSLATGLKQANPLLVIALTTISALVFAVPGATRAFAEMERQLGRIDAILKQTGNSAGFTVQQFESIAQELALNTLTSLRQARDSIGLLLSFPNIRTDNFERVLELSQDIAEVTGRDLKSSTEQVAKAVTDPIKGITRLTEVGVVFTKEQEQLIKKTQAANGTFEAQGVILDVLASQYGGAAKGAAEGLAGTLDTIGQRFENIQLKLGAIVNKTGALDYIGDLALNFENLAEQIYQAEGAIDVLNAIVISIKNGSREQSELLSQTLKAQALLNKVEKQDKDKVTPLNVEAESAVSGFDELKKQIDQDLKELGEIQEDTLKRIQKFEDKTKKDLKNQIKENNLLISASIAESVRARARALVETGDYTEEQFKLLEKNGAFDKDRFKDFVDNAPLLSDGSKDTLNIIKKSFEAISIDLEEEEGILDAQILALKEKVKKDLPEIFELRTDISAKSTEELRKIAANDFEVIIDAAKKQRDEEIRIEKERAKELKRLREENSKDLEKIALREKQQELDVEGEIINRQLRQDTDNITLKNEKLRIQNQKEILSLRVRELELEKQRTKAVEQANELRKDNIGLSDSQIEKITADGDKPFTNTLGEIERTNKEIDNLRGKIKQLRTSLKEEQEFNIDVNEQKINDQINTIIEDNSIKQKELAARLQGNTEQSIENQLSVIDEKYDKALKNIEERIGEIPDNVLNEISDSKALEKANTELDFAKKRVKELSNELKEGKISVESYATSIDELEARIEKLSKQTGVAIQELETNDIYKEYAERRLKDVSKEIDTILDKVEEADLSEGLTLKQEAFDRLNDLKKELEEIKKLNPDVDLSKETSLVAEVNTDISETYDATTKQIAENSKRFVSNLTKNIFDTLKKGESVSFEDVAVSAAYDVSNALLQKQLESITEMLLSPENTAGMLESMKGFFSFIGSSMVDGFAFLKDSASGALSSLFNGLKDFVSNIDFNAVIDTAKQAFKAVFDVIKGLISGASGGGGGGGGAEGGIFSAIGSSIGSFFHSGGLVGSGGEPIAINNSLLTNANKYHDGGYLSPNSQLKSDEMAAILQKGEYVIDKQTTKNLLNQKSNGSQGSGSQQIVNVVSGDEIANAVSGNGRFNDVIVNTIKNNRSQISEYIKR